MPFGEPDLFRGPLPGPLRGHEVVVAAGIIGCVAGTVVMLAMHYFDYQRALAMVQAQMGPGQQIQPPGLFGFIDIRAKEGVVIAGKGGGKGMNLGYVGSYIYFGVEFLFVVGICGVALFAFAQAPFCTECNTWKKERALGGFALPVEKTAPETCKAALAAFTDGKVFKLVDDNTLALISE